MNDHDDKARGAGGGPVIEQTRPDLAFALGGSIGTETETAQDPSAPPDAAELPAAELRPEPEPTPRERARELAVRIAHTLGELGPPGWREVTAVFTLTVAVGGGEVFYVDDQDQTVRVAASDATLELAAAQREVCAELEDGPWWRMFMRLDTDGRVDVDYDYGEQRFPDDQLLAPEAYLADLERFPRERLPMWLSAYLYHGDRQARPPVAAAARARADRAAGVVAAPSYDDFPDLPTLWVRWTVMSAAFVAARSEWGPRLMPSFGWFESAGRSGSTLYLLPRGRAVLSGGVWDAPELAAAYHDDAPLPDLYAGAPDWVVDQVLDPRASGGMLSFCYWWSGDRWYRGESPGSVELADAVPGIWDDAAVEQVIGDLVGAGPGDPRADRVTELLTAGFEGVVERAHLLAIFGEQADIDTAMNLLTMSGAAPIEP